MSATIAVSSQVDFPGQEPWMRVTAVANRSFLMFFTQLKLKFLLRKLRRGSCSVFIHSVSFVYLENQGDQPYSWTTYDRRSGRTSNWALVDVHRPMAIAGCYVREEPGASPGTTLGTTFE